MNGCFCNVIIFKFKPFKKCFCQAQLKSSYSKLSLFLQSPTIRPTKSNSILVELRLTLFRGLPKPPKPGTYREPGSVKFSKTRNRNLPGSPKTWQTSNRNLTRNRNQEFKALHLGLPRKFLVEPGILGKNQEVSQ